MPYWTIQVGTEFHNVDIEPTINAAGTLVRHTGQTFTKGTYRLVRHEGNRPQMSRGSVAKRLREAKEEQPSPRLR